MGAVDVEGNLDETIVRRVARQHRREIKYCYESQLVKNPKLAGVLNVQFVISASGSVVSAKTQKSTLDNKAVQACVSGKLRRWMFPEPTGGGIVTVRVPFAFSSSERKERRTGYGYGAGDLGKNGVVVPKIVPGKPVVEGPLDKEIIRRVVRQHRRELKHCYEAGLLKNPGLEGQVVVKFTITGTGAVSKTAVKTSSLKNNDVESCITGKLKRWVFPKPKGGKQVTVTYPVHFSI